MLKTHNSSYDVTDMMNTVNKSKHKLDECTTEYNDTNNEYAVLSNECMNKKCMRLVVVLNRCQHNFMHTSLACIKQHVLRDKDITRGVRILENRVIKREIRYAFVQKWWIGMVLMNEGDKRREIEEGDKMGIELGLMVKESETDFMAKSQILEKYKGIQKAKNESLDDNIGHAVEHLGNFEENRGFMYDLTTRKMKLAHTFLNTLQSITYKYTIRSSFHAIKSKLSI